MKRTKKQVDEFFKTDILPSIKVLEYGGFTDKPLIREAYNNYIDSLYKDREITEKQANSFIIPKIFLK